MYSSDSIEEGKLQKEDQQRLTLIVSIVEKNFSRLSSIRDPATRYTVLIDKLCSILDIGLSATESFQEDMDQELKDRIKAVTDSIQKELHLLLDWIQSPVNSPDHPYGHQQMLNSSQHFTKLKKKSKTKSKVESS